MDDSTTDGTRVHPPRRAHFLRLWGPPLAYTGIIFLLSFIPVGAAPKIWSAQDKVAHFLEFALLSALLFRALRPGRGLLWALLLAFLASTGMGVLVELVQALIPSRSAEFLDIAADAAGALAGALGAAAVFRDKPAGARAQEASPGTGEAGPEDGGESSHPLNKSARIR